MSFPFDKIGVSKLAPRKSLNSEDLIIEWLNLLPNGQIIGSHHIQDDVRQWIYRTYQKRINADTLARKFRGLRADKINKLENAGLELKDNGTLHGENSWILKRNM